MNTVLENSPLTITLPPVYPLGGAEIEYPESHDDDMGESSLHYALVNYIWSGLRLHFGQRDDVFVAADMNLYYVEGRPELYYTPDVMVILGIGNHERSVYKLWEEKVCPQVVFEVASDRTWRSDLEEKVAAYAQIGVEEYYALDSEDFLPLPLMAYRRNKQRQLEVLSLPESRIFSPCLGLEIVLTKQGFRLFDPERQEHLPTFAEMQAEAKAARRRTAAAYAKTGAAARAEAEAQVRQLLEELARLKGN